MKDETFKKVVIILLALLVGIVGVSAYIFLDIQYNHYSNNSAEELVNQTNNTSSDIPKEDNNRKTSTIDTYDSRSSSSKYMISTCNECGIQFTQLREGPGYFYCEDCIYPYLP